MVIAFCGHSEYRENKEDEKRIIEVIKSKIDDRPCDFFLGEYGNFDKFCYNIAKKIKEEKTNVKLVFVTPYIEEIYIKKRTEGKNRFDMILYPELEKIPYRYAITHRNRWIVQRAELIIAFVNRKYGGAYAMYKYAKRIGKEVYNIAE